MKKLFATTMILILTLARIVALARPAASVALFVAPDHAGVVATQQGVSRIDRGVDPINPSIGSGEGVGVPFQGYGSNHSLWSMRHTSWDIVSEQRGGGLREPAVGESSVPVGTIERSKPPAAKLVISSTCPISCTGPVFWDVPPTSGSIACTEDGCVVSPGSDDEVRVIIQLEDEPVSAYKSGLQAVRGRLMSTERDWVRAYASELQSVQQQLIGEIEAQGIELQVRREYSYILNGLAASVKTVDIERIEALPGVQAVHRDYQVHMLLDDSVPLIGADQVWTMQDPGGQPVTGHGIRVAILDTGIDYNHPDLGGCFGPGCKVMAGYDFVNDDADPWDDNGHGTHCAGIVAANGTVKGMAPDASLHAYKVLNQYGSGWDSDIIAAIERAVDPDGDPATDDAVDVISMSLGGGGDPDEPLALAVDAAVDEGVVMAVAAANAGPDYQTVRSPGVARKAFTVGATDKGDNIASFSSRGPVPEFYDLIKPDIVAPGVSINSTYPGEGHVSMSGTSMATPHIAGAAALIKQLHPSWMPEMIQASLMNTTVDLGLDIYTQGAGRVQVDDAAQAQAVLAPGSVGFGLVDVDQPLWTRTENLQFTNVTATSLDYSLQVSSTLPTGVTTTLSPDNVTIAAGESVTISFSITVDNALVPYQNEKPGSYEGQVIAQSVGESLVVPFSFIKSPKLEITFDEDPWIVQIHNGEDVQARYYHPGTSLSVLLPQGTYDIWTIYGPPDTWVIREGVVVNYVTNLSVNRSDAIHTVTLVPRDKDRQPVSQGSAMFIQQFEHTPSEIWSGIFWRNPSLTFHFSDTSADYTWSWRLDTGWKDAYYEFNDQLTGISSDFTYQNAPGDLWHIKHHCHTGPMQSMVEMRFCVPYG